MTVRRRIYEDSHSKEKRLLWMVDIRFQQPDGTRLRIRRVSPIQTRRGSEQYERTLREALLAGKYSARQPEAPVRAEVLFSAFANEFIGVYARAHNKPSELYAKSMILRRHLLPHFGTRRLKELSVRDVESYKAEKLHTGLTAKTVNNHLAVLGKCLRVAQEWGDLITVPRIKPLRLAPQSHVFLSFEQAERLVAAMDTLWRPMCILALRSGLRQGELRALRWADVDLQTGRLLVSQAAWEKTVGPPKSGRTREVALSNDAVAALAGARHERGPLSFVPRTAPCSAKATASGRCGARVAERA